MDVTDTRGRTVDMIFQSLILIKNVALIFDLIIFACSVSLIRVPTLPREVGVLLPLPIEVAGYAD